MTSVALITRAIPSANALARRLRAEGALDLVICERTPAPEAGRRATASRIVRRARVEGERLVDRLLSRDDAIARELAARRRVLGPLADPVAEPIEYISHRAWDQALAILERKRPDLICVFGTSLLPESVCSSARIAALNLHAGLAPQYRGNNCLGFAIINDDLENIGATLHLVTPRIDGGAIVAQARPAIETGDDEVSLMYKVHDLSHRLFVEIVRAIRRGAALDPKPQPAGVGHLYLSRAFTPGHARLVRRLIADGAVDRYLERKAAGRLREVPILGSALDLAPQAGGFSSPG
jgi:folate-dependent phosphoribosylglycinamide formyltransferase PurN